MVEEDAQSSAAIFSAASCAAPWPRADLQAALARIPGVLLREVRAADYTTIAVGGPLRVLELQSLEAASAVLHLLASEGEPYRVLGAGSNLLVSQEGPRAWVLKLGVAFKATQKSSDSVFSIGAGASLMSVSRELSAAGFSGLEFAGGIPASIGGSVVMNAGAHGGDMAQVVQSVLVLDGQGRALELSAQDLRFAYRHSSILPSMLVLQASLQLVPADPQRCADQRAKFLAERKARQPLQLPSSGSIFRNPSAQQTAGMLLEQAGLKGQRQGGAQFSELHANWIVNPKRQACFEDVQGLIALAQARVHAQFGLELRPELVIWE